MDEDIVVLPGMAELEAQIAKDEADRKVPDEEVVADTTTEEVQEETKEEVKEEVKHEDDDFQKRISRLAFEKRQAEKATKELQARLDRLEGRLEKLPEDEALKEKAAILAKQIANQEKQEAAAKELNQKANAIYRAGLKEYPDFDERLTAFRDLGGISNELIEAADEAGDAHKLIHYLSMNMDEADRITSMSPHKMGVALGKLASKLAAPPAPKPVSKAPAPIKPISGHSKAELPDDQLSMEEFIARDNERARLRWEKRYK